LTKLIELVVERAVENWVETSRRWQRPQQQDALEEEAVAVRTCCGDDDEISEYYGGRTMRMVSGWMTCQRRLLQMSPLDSGDISLLLRLPLMTLLLLSSARILLGL
jgi:hypothetical protein